MLIGAAIIGLQELIPVFVFTTKTSSIVGGATAAMYGFCLDESPSASVTQSMEAANADD